MMAYKFDDEPTEILDFAVKGDIIPERVVNALTDPNIIKRAFNAQFEIACLSRYYELDISQWYCTMVLACMCGYPASLDTVAKAMKLPVLKDREGSSLIRLFCMPNKKGIITKPFDGPQWQAFKKYCIRDVDVEHAVSHRLRFLKINDFERRLWLLDQKINNVGVMLDVQLAEQAVALNNVHYNHLFNEATEITGLGNANSPKQLKEWLSGETGSTVTALTKESVKDLLTTDVSADVERLLEIRQEMAKSSVKKYQTMLNTACVDDLIRYLFQLYGASKTGRWAGRGVQVQNLTHTKIPGPEYKELSGHQQLQKKLERLALAREVVRSGDLESLKLIYGNVSQTLSMLIRTMFIGNFTISDLSAIEARITAWLADEKWRMDVFRTHGKIYEASAAAMYKIPIEEVNKDQRFKGKIAELALGYGGGVNAMEKMGAIKMGLAQEELQPIVDLWRKSSPNIVKLWAVINEKALEAIATPGLATRTGLLTFIVKHNTLFIKLPSGRYLSYVQPSIGKNKWGGDQIIYYSTDQKTNQWCKQTTYGGKLLENIVQGIARDVLADIMLRLDEEGLDIRMHVHDEVVMESACVDSVSRIMSQDIPWAPGLPLKAETFQSPFYIKD